MIAQKKKVMMMQQAAPPLELYPVGTDVKAVYAPYPGSWSGSKAISTSTGEIISGSTYVNPTYIPISPDYTYQKNGQRMSNCAWYDADYQFIDSFSEYNTSVKNLPAAPSNASYMRISASSGTVASSLTITRTA